MQHINRRLTEILSLHNLEIQLTRLYTAESRPLEIRLKERDPSQESMVDRFAPVQPSFS